MTPIFTKMYAERLNNTCAMDVKEAVTGDPIVNGRVLIAPGGFHMKVKKLDSKYCVECTKGELVNGHSPSIDVLFDSVADCVGRNSIGIILTGMGYDGGKELLNMRKKGAITIGQDEESCVVYSMPKVAYDIGAVEKQVGLNEIPRLISLILNKRLFMMRIVGIGEYAISSNREEIIKTFSLGSCVALTMHCPNKKVSGMVHIVLPSPMNIQESIDRPAYFAETAIPLMINKFCYAYGCQLNDLIVGIFGGALSIRDNDAFKIGLRNVQMITSIMAEKDILIRMNETGGYRSRTVGIEVGTGLIKIDSQPMII